MKDQAEALKAEFNDQKTQGLNAIKLKYNELCQQVNVDSTVFVKLIQQKRFEAKSKSQVSSLFTSPEKDDKLG